MKNKTVLIIVGVVVLLLCCCVTAVAGGVLAYRYTPPSEEKVCEHLVDVLVKEAGDDFGELDQDDLDDAVKDCKADIEPDEDETWDEKKARAEIYRCFLEAEDYQEIDDCDEDLLE